ncbi:MAG: deoxyhypusine synthase [Candidatus Thermoplasmatota archaeon]|nr:deoxyhypusine synthase [Euryarchaeota archaeon]MBU4031175.1 deoxyhypusine synthase [Candidatus Thermoplasmatota archaeon]MBU4071903.1 deoxyhypusine synthase [Candidatus Thermoplasmatota archaeon]MBU4144775.1 deoxyhypusine synthase [Candidatus Thermoplasmatota archaeon]MBU4592225.1 deoxyhypusine synthase [Candidatus Thermoplasmatota archaeon]
MKMNEKVQDMKLTRDSKTSDIVRQMKDSGGFTAKKLAVGVDIIATMLKEKECVNFLSFPACIIATGTRGLIRDMLKEKMFDVVITTCGMLDHDLARIQENYYHGDFEMDDAKLLDEGVNRLGNILIPNESYGIVLERMMQPVLQQLWDEGKRELSTRELAWEFGKRVGTEDSILYWAAKNEIPIYVPGITDGAFGSQLWMFSQEHKDFKIDLLKDEKELSDIVFTAKKTGALMIGGGISKHHTIWWNQFRDGLDYAVYLTTAVEHDGSLSGARIKEAVSWGKVRKDAKYVTVEGDATILLPVMMGAAVDQL